MTRIKIIIRGRAVQEIEIQEEEMPVEASGTENSLSDNDIERKLKKLLSAEGEVKHAKSLHLQSLSRGH
jgi:hypothetical protein